MAIDPSIIMGVKPIQIANPLDLYSQAQQVQGLRNQNRLADLMYGEKEREIGADRALAGLIAQNKSPEDVASGLASQGYGSRSMAYTKQQQDILKQNADIDKTKAETQKQQMEAATKRVDLAGQVFGFVRDKPSLENAFSAIDYLGSNGVFTQQQVAQYKNEVQSDPSNIQTLADKLYRGAMSVKDQLAQYQTHNIGATTDTIAIDPVTGKVRTINSAANTASPDARLQSQTSRANNAANIAKDLTVAGMGPDGAPSADVETMAQGIASGKLAPMNGWALAKPRGQAVMARVMEINPNYDAGDYAAKNAALKGFSTGKEGTALRSFNVAVDHLDTLGQMADALDNKKIQIFNTVANAWKSKTGEDAPTNFDAVKSIVGKEVVKAIVAGGGGVAEREELSNLMNKANSPAQLKGVITHFRELMDAQRHGLLDQYQRTTGRTDGEKVFAPSSGGKNKNTLSGTPSLPAGWTVEMH